MGVWRFAANTHILLATVRDSFFWDTLNSCAIKMADRPGFFFCICPDPELCRDKVRGLLRQFPPPTGTAWEEHVFWGEDGLGEDFWKALGSQNLFGACKAVILRSAQALPADDWRTLSRALASVPYSTWPLICLEVAFDNKGAKIPAHAAKLRGLSFARDKGWVWESSGLNAAGLKALVRDYCAEQGLTADKETMDALAALLPADAGAARQELEKVFLAAADGVVTRDILQVVAHEPEIDVFAFLRALQTQAGGTEAGRDDFLKAWRAVLLDQVSKDSLLFPFLGALIREARTLWQILFKEKVFIPNFVLGEKQRLARTLGVRGVAALWDLALTAERGIKSGERKEEQALEALTAGLIALFQARAR